MMLLLNIMLRSITTDLVMPFDFFEVDVNQAPLIQFLNKCQVLAM